MAFAHVGKVVASLGFVGSVVLAAACGDYHDHDRFRGDRDDCDYVERQCQQVCDYYCDYYSCYPSCWDQCWDTCGKYPRQPSTSSSSGTVITDGGTSTPSDAAAPVTDASTGSGSGVLCSSCLSNADCEKDALCILRGGPPRDAGADGGPVGRGFCGAFCATSDNCPEGFLCSQIGQSRQCLPTGNACE